MNPETRALILALLENHDPASVHSMMRRNISTEPVSYTEIRSLRRGMLRSGAPRKAVGTAKKPRPSRAKPVPQPRQPRPCELRGAPSQSWVDPSERLLRRQLETGQHFISCPDMMARALRQAGMVA